MFADFAQLLSKNKKILLKDFYGASFVQFLVKTHHTTKKTIVIIVENQKAAEKIKDELDFFFPQSQTEILPGFDVPFYSGLSPLRRAILKTQRVYYQLLHRQLHFLICPKKAMLRRCLSRSVFESLQITLAKNDLIDRDELITSLVHMGYERYSLVEEPGQFAVRGDILDVFSPQYEVPHRISLFDIEIEEIRSFHPSHQRTEKTFGDITLIPAHEIFLHHYHSRKTQALIPDNKKQTPLHWVNQNWKSLLKQKADQKNIIKTKRDQIEDFIENRIYFHGIEFFLSLFYPETGTLFDYFNQNTLLVSCLETPWDTYTFELVSTLSLHQQESSHIESIFTPTELLLSPEELEQHCARFSCLYHETPAFQQEMNHSTIPVYYGQTESNLVHTSRLTAQITKIHSLAPLTAEINARRLAGTSCYIVCTTETQRERVLDLLTRFELPIKNISKDIHDDFIKLALSHKQEERLICILVGTLHEGYYSSFLKQWWITDEEIFGAKTKRLTKTTQTTTVFSSFSEIEIGDFLIHKDHGVGLYQGLTKLSVDPFQNDFVLIEYLGQDKLYVPIDKLNRVQKYAAADGASPQLDKLGGTTWIKTRDKAKKAARRLAQELLELQAKRELLTGHCFTPNHELIEEFEAGFAFEETPDQLQTIIDVYANLEADKPMDRLVCGDVGYGKTEVAIRAAYKAVLDNKQVAVLVPTTILAFQHFEVFKKRFQNYPVSVSLLSRFRTTKEQKETLKKLSEGGNHRYVPQGKPWTQDSVASHGESNQANLCPEPTGRGIDIVIGTHRLLSKDVSFRDLGLLIVDEEHRFGVLHKEKIKKLKQLVDVLTLTATPIPRTLNFALNGIRDLSIINTPPVDRLAIRTYTCYFDDVTIRDAIMKELRRGGQVFFVHNRVQSIDKITGQIARLVPEAKVCFAHGQMQEDDLETIMIDFMEKKFDILVCTTIIESGLDIPNANTMLINRADTFGLAQMYQLRGRVGRSDRQAYCYLIVPAEALQTNKAKRRLAVIQRFTELGSGFKVASHDLEIRGAGNILGDEQSGHIAAVGYDMYAQLLQEAIFELQNRHIPLDFEPEITLNIPAKIPEQYIPDEQLRLVLYKQLSSSKNLEEVSGIREEWLDRFGTLPEEIENLISLIKIKILCQQTLVSQIKQSGNNLFFNFHPNHQIDINIFTKAIQANAKEYAITRDGKFVVRKTFKSTSDQLDYIFSFVSGLL